VLVYSCISARERVVNASQVQLLLLFDPRSSSWCYSACRTVLVSLSNLLPFPAPLSHKAKRLGDEQRRKSHRGPLPRPVPLLRAAVEPLLSATRHPCRSGRRPPQGHLSLALSPPIRPVWAAAGAIRPPPAPLCRKRAIRTPITRTPARRCLLRHHELHRALQPAGEAGGPRLLR